MEKKYLKRIYNCHLCAGTLDGGCKSKCDPNTCESCVGGRCGYCGKYPYDPDKGCCNGQCYDLATQKCCDDGENEWICDKNEECCDDGSCAKPCELEQNTAMCTGETVPCPHWCDVLCESYYKINWKGSPINSCKEPGCPGDCQDDVKPICYTKTMCAPKVIVGQMCILSYCVAAPTQGFTCTICEHGQYPVENYHAPYNKKCGQ